MQYLNKLIYTIILLLHLMMSVAGNRDSIQTGSLNSFDLLSVLNPWLITTNPAGLSLMPNILPGKMDLAYQAEAGNYKRVQQGENINHYNFQTQRYTKIKNTYLF